MQGGGNIHMVATIRGDYRSTLEEDVAQELRAIGLVTEYEKQTALTVRYLPDFTMTGTFTSAEAEALYSRTMDAYEAHGGLGRTFQWVEVKPQDFLYRLRDTFGVTRRCGERFTGAVTVDCTSDAFAQRKADQAFLELYKPKKLAEVSGQNVLVVGRAGGTSSLTAIMTPTAVVFERNHPIANWARWMAEFERERQRIEIDRMVAEREAARQAEWQARQAEHLAAVRSAAAKAPYRANLFDSACAVCGETVAGGTGKLFRFNDGWKAAHKPCAR